MEVVTYSELFMEVDINGARVSSNEYSESCRQVFIFDTFVVKVDDGYQNECEYERYQRIEEEDKKYFPALIAYIPATEDKDSFIIQEAIQIDKDADSTDEQRELLEKICEKYGFSDMFLKGGTDYCGDVRENNHNVVPVGKDSIMIWDLGM